MPDAKLTGAAAAKLGHLVTWAVDLDATPVAPDDDSAAAGQVTVTTGRKTTSLFAQNDQLTITSANTGSTTGRISSVSSSSPLTVDIVSGNLLTEYVAERDIPAIGSGSPIAALDMAQQMILGRRCTYTGDAGESTYWSLAGHNVAFDANNNVVYGSNLDQITLRDLSTPFDVVAGAKLDAYRIPYTERSFYASGYAQRGDKMYATEGYGSTFPLATKRKMTVSYTVLLGETNVHTMRWDAGPDDSNTSQGKSMLLTIDHDALTADIRADFRTAGTPTTKWFDCDLTGIDIESEFRLIVEQEWLTTTLLDVKARIYQTVSGVTTAYPFISIGAFPASPIDSWARPFVLQGGAFRDLVIITGTSDYSIQNMYDQVIIAPPTTHYDVTGIEDMGLTSYPFAGMQGSLWDYIKYVTGATGYEFHADRGNVIRVVEVGDDLQELPDYVGSIQRTVSDQDAAQNIQFTNYNTDLPDGKYNPTSWIDNGSNIPIGLGSVVVYDSQSAGDTWSIGVNEVQTVLLNIDHFPSIVQNPKPASALRKQSYVS